MGQICAILFDAAGTLIHVPRGVGAHYREVMARHNITVDEKKLGAAFKAAFGAAAPREATGQPRLEDDKPWWRDLVRQVLAECGENPSEEEFHRMFEDLYGHFALPGVWELYHDVWPILDQLRGNYALGVLSNFDRRLYPILAGLGVKPLFEAITISSEIGYDKPDRRAFEVALRQMGLHAEETIYVGDDPIHDWKGAADAGLNVYKVERPGPGLIGLPAFIAGLPQRPSQ